MSLWDKIITQNEIDSALIRDLSDLSYKTTKGRREKGRSLKDGIVNVGTLPFLEKPPPDAITKEMILDYQKSLTEPLKDAITGKPITDKYYPATFAYDVSDITTPPTLINEPTLGKPADQTDIELFQNKLELGVAKIQQDRQKFKEEKDLLTEMKSTLNFGKLEVDSDGYTNIVPWTISEKKKLETDIGIKDRDIRQLEREMNALYLDNGNIKKIIMSIKENIKDNKNLIIQHNKSINDNLQKYRENFLTQNQNKMVVEEQRPNETQEEYLQRMKDMQAEQFDMNLYQEKANLHQIHMLKKNLRQIFSNDAMIENIIKSFKEEQRFIINKHFPEIREYILETYGKNNTNLSLEDIVEVITSHLERILNPPIEYNVGEDEITAAAPTAASSIKVLDSDVLDTITGKPIPTDFKFGTDKNSLYIENDKEGSHVYFKIAETPEGKEILLYSTDTNEAGKFRQVMERAASGKSNDDVLRNIITNLKIDDFAKNKILNKKASKVSDLIGELKSQYSLEPIKKGLVMKKLNTLSGSKKYLRYGAGIKDPEQALPEYAYFGEIVIMLSKLYYNNILSVKMKSGRAIDGFRNAKVSNFFVDIIMNMYANKDVSSLIKDLSVDEKNLMNSLLFQAKLHKKYITNTNETLSQLKEKHKVIEGEILAGNNNPKLIKELKDVLMKLYHFKAISIPAINKYLKNFE
jgi:hypothetical protein